MMPAIHSNTRRSTEIGNSGMTLSARLQRFIATAHPHNPHDVGHNANHDASQDIDDDKTRVSRRTFVKRADEPHDTEAEPYVQFTDINGERAEDNDVNHGENHHEDDTLLNDNDMTVISDRTIPRRPHVLGKPHTDNSPNHSSASSHTDEPSSCSDTSVHANESSNHVNTSVHTDAPSNRPSMSIHSATSSHSSTLNRAAVPALPTASPFPIASNNPAASSHVTAPSCPTASSHVTASSCSTALSCSTAPGRATASSHATASDRFVASHFRDKTGHSSSTPNSKSKLRSDSQSTSTSQSESSTIADDIIRFHQAFSLMCSNISHAVIGADMPIRLCVTALFASGHVLVEDNPGTGKTRLAKSLARSLDASFSRIQFTADMLPSDVTGVTFYDRKTGDFAFRKGPVFASVVLADEINRASPKTQSALLEVMEEHHVTVDGTAYDVPDPFLVIATQNPIEHLGTYRLPEAQMDRFLIRTSIGYPHHDDSIIILTQAGESDIVNGNNGIGGIGGIGGNGGNGDITPVLGDNDIQELRRIASHVHIDGRILDYIMMLVEATRHDERIMIGSSMRGALALMRCARVWAASEGRDYVVPSDVIDLAIPALAHRLTLTSDALFHGHTDVDVVKHIIKTTPVPTIGVQEEGE